MGKQLSGTVVFPKSIATDDFWHSEPFDRPRAFMDLNFLANDRRRQISVRGQPMVLERGQLAHSIVSLAERWRWSRPKVTAFLVAMQDERRLMVKTTNTTTIITVMDYTVYNEDSTPETAPELTADFTPELTANVTADFTQKIGSTEEGSKKEEGGRGGPRFTEVEVPGLKEFTEACGIRGIPAWYAEREHAWRSERPADRWPLGAHWTSAVTTTFNRWREAGAPMEMSFQKNSAKKTPGVWELSQQIAMLREQEKNHPANENSAAWMGEATEAELADLSNLRQRIAAAESAMTEKQHE